MDPEAISAMVGTAVEELVIPAVASSMPRSIDQVKYKKNPDEIGKRLEMAAMAAVQLTAARLGRKLVMGTPILTGNARKHWAASINGPSSYTTTPPYPNATAKNRAPASYGRTVITRNNAIIYGSKAGDAIYFTNNAPYIMKLEYTPGYSKQAPNGWVRLAIFEMKQSDFHKRAFESAFKLGYRPRSLP